MPFDPPAADGRRPFTRADAVRAGISPEMLRGSKFRRVFRDVYIDVRAPDHPFTRGQAALLLHPQGAFLSHFSAGRLYEVPLPVHPFEHVTVWERDDRVYRPGLKPHVTCLAGEEDVTLVRGLRVSKPARMFVELAGLLGLVDLVVVGDALLRLNLVTLHELLDHCERSRAHHARKARAAAAHVRQGVDSAMETRLRLLIVLAGLPEPEVNWKLRRSDGSVAVRFDLSYPMLKLAVEYDGRQHAVDGAQWRRDLERREWLDRNGWRLVVVNAAGIYRDPVETIDRVRLALGDRGHVVASRALLQDWRPFYLAR